MCTLVSSLSQRFDSVSERLRRMLGNSCDRLPDTYLVRLYPYDEKKITMVFRDGYNEKNRV
jgi:hypothetical protein